MKNIHIIGTLHAGLTPHSELQKEIEKYNPDLLLVEIIQDELQHTPPSQAGHRSPSFVETSEDRLEGTFLNQYPDEMVFAFNWAMKSNVKVKGFDVDINIFKENIRKEDEDSVLKNQMDIIKGKNWKDFNNLENVKLLNKELFKIVDKEKWDLREKLMIKNIKKALNHNERSVIICGCGHLEFFFNNLELHPIPVTL